MKFEASDRIMGEADGVMVGTSLPKKKRRKAALKTSQLSWKPTPVTPDLYAQAALSAICTGESISASALSR